LSEALDSVEVTHTDEGRSGFQIVFRVGRSTDAGDMLDYRLLSLPLLRPFSRIILIVTAGVTPKVLMDGIITHQQLRPSNDPGGSRLTVTGEDVSVMMDLEEKTSEYPAQDETVIANEIILHYSRYGLIPEVIPPPSLDPPLPIERTPTRNGTDLAYLEEMAARYGYVFYVTPGPAPFTNRAYWGPPVRIGLPQPALTVNMGSATNVESINFQNNALAPTIMNGVVVDRRTDQSMPVRTFLSTRPPLVSQPALLVSQPNIRSVLPRARTSINYAAALAQAQGVTDASTDNVVTASGQLDALRYGNLLQARSLVGVRGVGYSYDGNYYVKSVTHTIQRGAYQQSFSLAREGVGALFPVVRP